MIVPGEIVRRSGGRGCDRKPHLLASNAKLPYCRGYGHALVVRQLARARRARSATSFRGSRHRHRLRGTGGLPLPLPAYRPRYAQSFIAVAPGMALAEVMLPTKGLKPIVMIGNGGAMIGLLHLVHAAQLNVDVTVLVITTPVWDDGGQHSALTPLNWIPATTPEGN